MARAKGGGRRSAHKTLRLTTKARFAVDVFAQKQGQSGNAFISEAVAAYAKIMAKKYAIDIEGVWHADVSVRELRLFLLTDEVFPFDDDQAKKRTFVMQHRQFFYTRGADGEPVVDEHRAIELYPRLEEWRNAAGDHWAPGRAMAELLRSRGMATPVWPPEGAAP